MNPLFLHVGQTQRIKTSPSASCPADLLTKVSPSLPTIQSTASLQRERTDSSSDSHSSSPSANHGSNFEDKILSTAVHYIVSSPTSSTFSSKYTAILLYSVNIFETMTELIQVLSLTSQPPKKRDLLP